MRYQTMWRQAAAPGGRTGIVAILLSAVMLLPMPAARAADQSSLATETPPAGSGPLTTQMHVSVILPESRAMRRSSFLNREDLACAS